MKYCFVGVGSIARKHISNLKKIDDCAIIHALRSGHSSYKDLDDLIDKQCFSFEDLDDEYDAVFITNPTSLHFETFKRLYNKANTFFIEKPVFSQCKAEEDIVPFLTKKTYIAAPLRFCAGIKYAKALIEKKGKPNSIRAISSSYLPDWRPGVDYRNTYSAHKDLGGGVHIDLIHELDYVSYLIGCPTESYYINGKVSDLEIDSYDISASIHRAGNTIAEIHLDYFGRDKKRICELYYNDKTYYINLLNNTVKIVCRDEAETIKLEPCDMYFDEMSYFIGFINSSAKVSINDVSLANRILRIINEKGERK